MRISDWSSDVCSSDLRARRRPLPRRRGDRRHLRHQLARPRPPRARLYGKPRRHRPARGSCRTPLDRDSPARLDDAADRGGVEGDRTALQQEPCGRKETVDKTLLDQMPLLPYPSIGDDAVTPPGTVNLVNLERAIAVQPEPRA